MVSVPARRQQVGYGPGAWPLGAAGLHAVLSGAIGVGVSQPEGREYGGSREVHSGIRRCLCWAQPRTTSTTWDRPGSVIS